ncbi:MAG TPA: hypothetical protein VH012_04730 [Acidimicrobiales bacterium]|nr:hypothetical protein [Acidimicrobiales bacterium]
MPELDPLPMFGQSLVEPDPELDVDPDPDAEDELEDPVPVLPEPVLPEFELDDGVVVDDELELVPELPDVVDVVAALATIAPPATRPEVSAPAARTLRRRICMACVPFRLGGAPARSSRYITPCAFDLGATAE